MKPVLSLLLSVVSASLGQVLSFYRPYLWARDVIVEGHFYGKHSNPAIFGYPLDYRRNIIFLIR
jgi:hypothetical protein